MSKEDDVSNRVRMIEHRHGLRTSPIIAVLTALSLVAVVVALAVSQGR